MGLQQGSFPPRGPLRQPALMLSDSVEKSSGDSDLQEGIEKVAMVHLASELSSVLGLEGVEVVKNTEQLTL